MSGRLPPRSLRQNWCAPSRSTESRLPPDGDLGPLSNIIALYGRFRYGGFVFSFFAWVLVLGLALVVGFIVLSVTPETDP